MGQTAIKLSGAEAIDQTQCAATGSLNVTPNTTEHHLIARSD